MDGPAAAAALCDVLPREWCVLDINHNPIGLHALLLYYGLTRSLAQYTSLSPARSIIYYCVLCLAPIILIRNLCAAMQMCRAAAAHTAPHRFSIPLTTLYFAISIFITDSLFDTLRFAPLPFHARRSRAPSSPLLGRQLFDTCFARN